MLLVLLAAMLLGQTTSLGTKSRKPAFTSFLGEAEISTPGTTGEEESSSPGKKAESTGKKGLSKWFPWGNKKKLKKKPPLTEQQINNMKISEPVADLQHANGLTDTLDRYRYNNPSSLKAIAKQKENAIPVEGHEGFRAPDPSVYKRSRRGQTGFDRASPSNMNSNSNSEKFLKGEYREKKNGSSARGERGWRRRRQ